MTKINLGCGLAVLPGFENIDNSPSVFLAKHPLLKRLAYRFGLIGESHYRTVWPKEILWQNAARRLCYADASVDKIYSSHFLEHVPYANALRVLGECRRVLKPGGLFRLVVPDLLYHARLYVEATEQAIASGSLDRTAHDAFLESVCGKYITRHRSAHCYMYDWPTLSVLLPEIGFSNVRQRAFRESADSELAALDNRPDDSLIVEMTKV